MCATRAAELASLATANDDGEDATEAPEAIVALGEVQGDIVEAIEADFLSITGLSSWWCGALYFAGHSPLLCATCTAGLASLATANGDDEEADDTLEAIDEAMDILEAVGETKEVKLL